MTVNTVQSLTMQRDELRRRVQRDRARRQQRLQDVA